ncbi:MAG TPA: multiheme c-type cytochrome [Candidatus Saccharimonadaceae bacterium]|jgi:2',3'-cyclic-nucleotide 2'-phosphodiesterase (5'-nucleotidase family)|nr:multiheme c-type cytochrome [Candidatus Saccharimonadaceae bacterium]
MKTSYSQILLVDDGGFFPEDDVHEPFAGFLMDGMKLLGTDAVGVGDRDLRFGISYLKARATRAKLPVLSANLINKFTQQPALSPSVVKKVGTVKVGVFGLISDKADLGPSRDTLLVQDPTVIAKRTVADLRKQGATVVVLLSQLGKVETEDLVAAVDGIDCVIVGRNVPLVQSGRMIKDAIAVYGADQGQYMGRTILSLDAARKATAKQSEMFLLSPEVGENAQIAALVKGFEDKFNEEEKKREQQRAVEQQKADTGNNPDHFVGVEVCSRCHTQEAEQWKTTKHAQAWQTLVDAKKDATPECVSCHVVGYKQAGGFQNGTETPKLGNVQCENCHGMGTNHEAFAANPAKITEATCVTCHNPERSPTFNFATYEPHIMHQFSGTMPALPAHPNTMGGH